MKTWVIALGLVTSLAATAPPVAADGNAASGYAIAKERCARCHNIEKGGVFKKMPPTFQSIAVYRTELDIWSRIVSPSPHSGMPTVNWALTGEEVHDLVTYIVSLDTPVKLGN